MLYLGQLVQKVLKVQENQLPTYQVARDDAGAKAEQGLRTLTVQVSPGSGRETALFFNQEDLKFYQLDTTPMPHNGARPPKEGEFNASYIKRW